MGQGILYKASSWKKFSKEVEINIMPIMITRIIMNMVMMQRKG
jgi:hypothetical protein